MLIVIMRPIGIDHIVLILPLDFKYFQGLNSQDCIKNIVQAVSNDSKINDSCS